MKIKSIIRIVLSRCVIILHLHESEDFRYCNLKTSELHAFAEFYQDLPIDELAKKFTTIHRISSIEITDWNSNGVRIEI